MYLSENNIQIIKDSFKKFENNGNAFSTCFYQCLFDLSPIIRPMFKKDMRAQELHFIVLLTSAIENIDNPNFVIEKLNSLAEMHVNLGVNIIHFKMVKRAFLLALEYELRSECKPSTTEAWSQYYDWLAKPLISKLNE
jgi:nitric oxide dioxygenase